MPRLAVAVQGGPFVDLVEAWQKLEHRDAPFGDSTSLFIEQGAEAWARTAEIAARAAHNDDLVVDEKSADFEWLCPLDRLSSLRDFLTFEDHVKRGAERRGTTVSDYWYEAPVYYKGNHRSVLGPDQECPWPDYTERLDFELELAMVVGGRAHDLSMTAAEDLIFGFTIYNDFSARDIQAREMATFLGPAKGKDFANAFGPWIVTADELGTQPDLEMICRVNGEELGRARSSAMHWRWAEMLAHVSRSEDVYPCDVYGSGTPGGCCGLDLDRFLQAGDVVELEIEAIGVLRNTVGAPLTPPAR